MKNKNICKFISEGSDNSLSTSRFILETNLKHGVTEYSAAANRVLLFTEGEGSVSINGKEYAVQTGSIVFAVTGMKYSLQNKNKLHFMYIDYSGNRAETLMVRFGISESNAVFHGMSWMIPIWKESLVKANEENIDLLSESMLLYAFSQLNCERAVPDASSVLIISTSIIRKIR